MGLKELLSKASGIHLGERITGHPPTYFEPKIFFGEEIGAILSGCSSFGFRNTPRSESTPLAKSLNEQGIACLKRADFLGAISKFSEASAADPKTSLYTLNTQLAQIAENERRYFSLPKNDRIRMQEKEKSGDSELPGLGPFIEIDHNKRVAEFAKRFAGKPGADKVIENAINGGWIYKFGAAFQIKVAEKIGPELIRGFEQPHKPEGFGLNYVDIAMTNNVAIECKNFIRNVGPGTVRKWIEQAIMRLVPDQNGYCYQPVYIIIPDEKNLKEIQQWLEEYMFYLFTEFSHGKGRNKIKIMNIKDLESPIVKLKLI